MNCNEAPNIQVIWGGRWQEGSACSAGEEVEQINSHMSRCGKHNKVNAS